MMNEKIHVSADLRLCKKQKLQKATLYPTLQDKFI